MNPELFERVTELFDAVRHLPRAERMAYLDESCGGDGELRAEVESLLAHHDTASGLLSESARSEPEPSEVDREELLATIAHEYRDCLARGESPDIDEIARRHPAVSELVRRTLGALNTVRSLPPDSAGDDADPLKSRNLGDFRILREIGRGGMGVVFEAEQLSLGRRVALKVLPFAAVLDSRQLQRFKNEAQAAALLHHENIVPVHGIGSARGVHYYAMQYIEGHTVADVIRDRRRLEEIDEPTEKSADTASRVSAATDPTAARTPWPCRSERPSSDTASAKRAYFRSVAEVGIQVAEALDHAHAEGVVHRDIKPSNLIMDAAGKIWVTDFGLARVESDRGLTRTGDLIGTLRYMSPEQALAKRVVVDHRTDIYSLGVTLYELLTLRPAYPDENRQELIRKIAFEEPRPPRRLSKWVPVELETIVLKATAKNPSERFATAREVAEDLRRFLDDKPIRARRATLGQRITKWSRRHRGVVAAVAVVLMMAVAGLAFSNFLIVQQRDAAQARLVRLTIANGMRHLDQEDLLGSLPWFTEALRLDQANAARADLHRMRIHSTLSQCPRLVAMWFHEGPVTHRAGSLDLLLSINAEFSPDGRYVVAPSGNMSARVWDTTTGEVVHVLKHTVPVIHACFSSDGRKIATATGDVGGGGPGGAAFVWDAVTGGRITPPLAHERAVRRVWFDRDGDRVVTASEDHTARVWDARTGKPVTPPMKHDSSVYSASFSPDGGRVVTACASENGGGGIWDSVTGEQTLRFGTGRHAEFSPDGSRVVIGKEVWDTSSGNLRATLAGGIWHASFSPDGRWVVTAGTAQIWDATTFRRVNVGTPLTHQGAVAHAKFSPDSRHVVTAGWDRTARVWETTTGRPITLPLKHGGDVMCANFSPDGRRIVTASTNLLVRVWDLSHLKAASRPLPHPSDVNSAKFSPDGRRVVTACADGSARLWDVATGEPVAAPLEHSGEVRYAAFSPDGLRVLTASNDGTARAWDATTGEAISPPLKHGNRPVVHASFSPDGRRLVSASNDGTARVWDGLTGKAIAIFEHAGPVKVAWFSPDDDRVLTASGDAAQIWDAVTERPITPPLKHKSAILDSSWSPDGLRVLTTSYDGTAGVWDAATGHPTSPPLWHGQAVTDGAFSPDGRRVVTASNDNTARVWDAVTGIPLTPPLGWQRGNPTKPSFSSDGRRIVTISLDAARIWDAATGEPLTGLLRHDNVSDAEFSPDGLRLLTAGRDGTARLWDLLPDDRPVEDLELLAQVLCGHRIDATGGNLEPVEPRALRDAWQNLRDKYPDDFVSSREDVFTWHRDEAEACARLEKWSDVIKHLETADRLATMRASMWKTLGVAYYRHGNFEKTIESLRRSEQNDRENAGLRSFFLAMAHWKLGQEEKARKWYSEAVEAMKSSTTEDEELVRLRAEAAELIGSRPTGQPTADRD